MWMFCPPWSTRATAGSTPPTTRLLPPPGGSVQTTRTSRISRSARKKEGRSGKHLFRGMKTYILLSADYSQIELRIIAHMSRDAGMIGDFRAGLDIHTATASKVYGIQPGRSDQGDAQERENRQFRDHLRDLCLRPFGTAEYSEEGSVRISSINILRNTRE